METMLVTMEYPGPLPLQSHIRQTRAEYGTKYLTCLLFSVKTDL